MQAIFFLAASLQSQREWRDGWLGAAVASWRICHDEGDYFIWAPYWTILVSVSVFFQTASTNQIFLLLSLLGMLVLIRFGPGHWQFTRYAGTSKSGRGR